jgi:CheY-like chemotaxis protein
VATSRAASMEALKSKSPFAVVAQAENFSPDDDTELRALRSQITARVPLVVFSLNVNEMPEFRLFDAERQTLAPAAGRLIDAIRRSKRTNGKELKTVLIIDDEPALLELLAMTLVKKGFRVLSASDGRAGVELAQGQAPDAIILDLAMPDLNGSQIVEKLRADSRTKGTPILIHTGIGLDEQERHRLASQVQAITFKSEQDVLFAELERLETQANEPIEMAPTV